MQYAALVRPPIDRVYSSLRLASRPRTREVVEHHQRRPGFIASFYFGLLARPMPAAALDAALTYVGVDMSEELADGVALVDGEGTWSLTEAGTVLAVDFQRAVGEGTQQHWEGIPEHDIDELCRLLGLLLDAGKATGGPAFAALAPPHEPEGALPTTIVSSRLGALRHHRADAHRAAWQGAGLTLEQLRALPPNSAERIAIEAETNRLDAPIYAALTEDERWKFLGLLAKLP